MSHKLRIPTAYPQVLTGVQTLDVLAALPELGISPKDPPKGAHGVRLPSGGSATPPPPGLLPAMFKRLTSELPSASGGQLASLLQVNTSLHCCLDMKCKCHLQLNHAYPSCMLPRQL